MYKCVRCDETVDDADRASHSGSEAHQENGGSADVVDDDYEEIPHTRGTSKTQ